MRSLILFVLFISVSFVGNGQVTTPVNRDSIQSKIVIIGDAGVLINGRQPVIEAVRKNVSLNEKTVVIFLGDNLYDNGLPDESSPEYTSLKTVLESQIVFAKGSRANIYFIPDNSH